MAIKIYIPIDAAALSVGAEEVAKAIAAEAVHQHQSVHIVRNGSRGLFWLEPMIEVETARGRIAYGPVEAHEVAGLFDCGFLTGGNHAKCLGLTENIPYLKRQQRLTFARIGVIDPLSLDGYRAMEGFKGLARALGMAGKDIVEEVLASGLRGRGGAGFPTDRKSVV